MKINKKRIISLLIAFGVLFSVFISTGCTAASPSPVKVIFDCDMGYMNDDALALSLLIKAKERGLVDILGITLTGGNNFIDATYENYGQTQFGSAKYTKDLLTALSCTDIQVYRGTDIPTDMSKNDLGVLDTFFNGLEYIKFDDGYGAILFLRM